MKERRSPLVKIPPLRGGDVSRHGGLPSDGCFLSVHSARGSAPALLSIGPTSPPGNPLAWLHPCSAPFRFTGCGYCSCGARGCNTEDAVCCRRSWPCLQANEGQSGPRGGVGKRVCATELRDVLL